MKVILLEKISNLGEKLEIKEVKDGYVRNFLLPRKLVKIASPANLKWLEQAKKSLEEKARKDKKEIKKIIEKLAKIKLSFIPKSSDEGSLYGSITPSQIIKAIQEKKVKIEKEWLKDYTPIKKVGDYRIELKLPYQQKAEIKISVKKDKDKDKDKG